jgi:hypothetical protein
MKLDLATIILLFLILATIVLFIIKPFGEQFILVSDSLAPISALVATVTGFYAFRVHGFKNTQGKALFFVSLGTFFWFGGELAWSIFETLGKEVTSGTIADVFWIIGYVFYLIGFYHVWKVSPHFQNKLAKIAVIVLVAAISIFMIKLSLPTLTDLEMTVVEKTVTVGYVIGDMMLLNFIAVLTGCLVGSKFFKVWQIFFAAILIDTVADVYYNNFVTTFSSSDIINALWIVSYFIFALNFLYYRHTIYSIMDSTQK